MQIGLLTLLKALWKRMWLVILAVLLCGAAGFCIARFCVTPMYKAGVMMYVNNNSLPSGGKDTISSSDLSAAQVLALPLLFQKQSCCQALFFCFFCVSLS